MNRICPDEKILSAYLEALLSPEERKAVEKHLAGCSKCRKLLIAAHNILKEPGLTKTAVKTRRWFIKNMWLLGSAAALIFSFLVPRHFLQFLAAFLIMGAKWITDSRTTKTLIMIHEAWKRGNKNNADNVLTRFNPDK
ncbi:MAG: zf-HC2 domain-containing protein [Candidatus Omnitrophota bacterium]